MKRPLQIIVTAIIFICPLISYGNTTLLMSKPIKTGYHINKNNDLIPNNINENKKVILITIDDGPSKYGKEITDILIKHKAKAIFFINGIYKKYFNNITDEYKLGFTIGNHTWNHINLKKEKNFDIINKEIDSTTKLITKLTGSAPRFFRPPYGEINTSIKSLVKKDNMIFMNWSGSDLDWEANTKDEKIFDENVINDLHPGEILLIHEHSQTAKYLDKLLTILEEKGYSFADPSQITN
jgi:peptidoglycan-N-acetylglucosamine deacetylase